MNYRVRLASSGDASITAQVEWYRSEERHGGEELAERWFSKLHVALATLATAPMRHGFAPENKKWLPEFEIRQMHFRPWKSGVGWRVLYTIDEDAQFVTVLQVRHEHRRRMFEATEDESRSAV